MSTKDHASSNYATRATYSCIRCASRKVKCDRQNPCSACVKHNVECTFKIVQPNQQRRKRVKVQALTERLKYYESLLQEQGVDVGKVPNPSDSDLRGTPSHNLSTNPNDVQPQPSPSIGPGSNKLVNEAQSHGETRFRFVENTLWERVAEEAHNSPNNVEDSEWSDLEASDDEPGFVLSSRPRFNTKPHHPSPNFIHQLWTVFIENIDPLTKIVHVPSLGPVILKASNNIKNVPRNLEALMFAIYSTAIMSLKDDECKQQFSESRQILLSRYTSATEAALARAKFMGTTSLITLQALVLHLLSVRDMYEPRAVWALTGVAVRIAQVMGLARDGSSLGLPPFETEMRRRIWWQIKFHDFRTAELCGLAKFRDLETGAEFPHWPTNINDSQLFPGMPSFPVESNAITDAVFVAIRCELTKFAASRVAKFRQVGKDLSQWNLDALDSDKDDVDKASKELEEILETKYLRYCDPSQPLHLLTLLVTRYGINVLRFLRHHPRRWASADQVPSTERLLVWEVSVKLLEQYNMAHSNPLLKRFAWHSAYFQQWHAIIHVLDTLQANPTQPDADKAWQLVEQIYEHNSAMVSDMKKPIHIAVANLCLKAYIARELAMMNYRIFSRPMPGFIMRLRQQHETAKAKKKARDAERNRLSSSVTNDPAKVHDVATNIDASMNFVSASLESTSLQPNIGSDPLYLAQDANMTESDPFYFFTGLDEAQLGVSDMDLDLGLALDYNVDNRAPEAINWDQWDTWLANSNIMRPIPS